MKAYDGTFTIGTANDAGINEKAIVTMIAAENASKSCKLRMWHELHAK